MTVAFGESTMNRTQVQLWYNQFKESRLYVYDDVRPGRPSTSITDENIEAVKKIILDNRRIAIREVTDDDGISFGSCQEIFTDVLGMKRAAPKIAPKLLNFEQKQHRMDIAQEMLTTFNDNPDLLKKVITRDESWVYGYSIESPVIPMDASNKVKTEKSTSNSVKCEGFAHCFLRLQCRGAS